MARELNDLSPIEDLREGNLSKVRHRYMQLRGVPIRGFATNVFQ